MSKIWETIDLLKRYNQLDNEEAEHLQKKIELEAYKENNFEDLVSISRYLDEEAIFIGDMDWEDYEIQTYTRYSSLFDEYFTNEDEYYETMNKYIDEEVENLIDSGDYIIKEVRVGGGAVGYIFWDNTKDDEDDFDLDDFFVRDSIKGAEEDRDNDLAERVVESIDECWEDLDVEYDEIMWNYVYNFGGDVDYEAAEKAGLGVVYVNSQEKDFLFLTGCGMDMSFCFVKYLAYTYKSITENYLDRLNWTRQNSSEEEFIEILELLGLDRELLTKYLKPRR